MLTAEPAGKQQLSVKTGARRGTRPSKAEGRLRKRRLARCFLDRRESPTHQELLKACQLAAIPFVLTSIAPNLVGTLPQEEPLLAISNTFTFTIRT